MDIYGQSKEFALKNCKHLYRDLHRSCMETCMCWGWEFGEGWNNVVGELSSCLEMINLDVYPKYGVRIIMDQAKEKYGTLRIYYHVEVSPPLIFRIWHLPFKAAHEWLRSHVDFKYKTVVDKEAHTSTERVEIPSDKVEDEKKRWGDCSNVKFEEADGKCFKVTEVWHCQQSHREPTKHKLLHALMRLMSVLDFKLTPFREPSPKQLVVQDAVDFTARKLIADAERRCYDVCEDCGTQIGTEYSPRVETNGWISYICEKCDAKRRIEYAKHTIEYSQERKDGKKLSEEDQKRAKEIFDAIESGDFIYTEDYVKYAKEIEEIADKL